MKRALHIICITLISISIWAVKASPELKTYRQPDGSTIQVRLVGDENFHYFANIYGEMLIKRENGMFEKATAEEIKAKREEFARMNARKSYNDETLLRPALNTPSTGTVRIPVILVQFPEKESTYTDKESLDKYMNSSEISTTKYTNYRSIQKVFDDSSFGKFKLIFDYYGTYTTDESEAYYAGNNGRELFRSLIAEMVTKADPDINFADYDSNNDGYVDGVVLMCAGTGQNESHEPGDIWPCTTSVNVETQDGVTVYRCSQTAEMRIKKDTDGNITFKGLNGNGTFCHEFCHMIGLPDLYTTKTEWQQAGKGKDNYGMEVWDIMDSGCYMGDSYRTIDLSAWERELLGWYDIPTLEQKPQDVSLKPLSLGGDAYRIINPENPNEYWILENRQKIDGDRYLYSHGLLISHVDYDYNAFGSNKINNEENHPRFYLIAADGKLTSTYNECTQADFLGDLYPGEVSDVFSPVREFNRYEAYYGEIDLPITDIKEDTETGTISFKFMGGAEPSGISTVSESKAIDNRIYSPDGQFVGTSRSALPHGIYMCNGHKFTR